MATAVGSATDTKLDNAIDDALSDEAKSAIDALPDLLFDGDVGRLTAKLLANEILWVHRSDVHEHGQSVWSIQCDGAGNGLGFVVVNVGNVNTISRDRSGVRFLVLRDAVAGLQARFGDSIEVTDRTYSERAFLAELSLHNADMEITLPSELREAHEGALDRVLAEDWKINQRWKWHRDDWRMKLAIVSGLDLPAPSYVPADRIGLRMDSNQQSTLGSVETSDTIQSKDRANTEVTNFRLSLERQFGAAGLNYSRTQIASFYTALQTKGFVILSGISGTGKSKIAQRFAELLELLQEQARPTVDVEFIRPVEPYMKKYNLFVVPKELSGTYVAPEPGTGYSVKLCIDGSPGAGRLQNPRNLKTGEGWSVRLSWKGPLRDHFANMGTESIRVRMRLLSDGKVEHVDITPELENLEATAEIETIGISASRRSNHLFLPVRPDWRDGKALIGYHNPLTGEYVRTGFLDFVIAAQDDFRTGNRNAFFVILDEMNLAHVEYYFADVLSVIESGRDADGWTVEGIPLTVDEQDSDLPEHLHLPPNLYIVGTVNMDETTHPFSPKVLDRAFTIELTDVDFSGYPPEPVESTADLSDEGRRALLDAFIAGGDRYPRIDKGEIRATVERHEQFRTDLASLNASLKRYRMHFGYRVFDEIMQFVHNAECNELFASPNDAFDHAVLMKVLPKFNGSLAKLKNPLFELVHWCDRGGVLTPAERAGIEAQFVQLSDDLRPFDSIVMTNAESADDAWRYPATGRRAALMMQDLYADGFAAFG